MPKLKILLFFRGHYQIKNQTNMYQWKKSPHRIVGKNLHCISSANSSFTIEVILLLFLKESTNRGEYLKVKFLEVRYQFGRCFLDSLLFWSNFCRINKKSCLSWFWRKQCECRHLFEFFEQTSPKGFSASKCDVGNWIFSKS